MDKERMKDIEINLLDASNAQEISSLLTSSSKQYSSYFIPFSFDEKNIESLLHQAIKDKFYGVFVSGRLVGFFMLRGFDEGYSIPSYGVWIAEEFSNKGLSTLTLQHAISFCKINSIKKVMLKVHPDNLAAKHIYEKFGFKQTGTDSKNHHLIFHKDI
jgi:RimJ/RimL family protein N-acetyltransferase